MLSCVLCSNAPMLQWSCATMLIWLHCCSVVLLISYASTWLCSCAAISLLQCCCAAMQCCYTPQSSRWCALLIQKLFTCVMNCLATVLCCVVLCCVVVLNLALASIWYECMSVHYMIVHFIVAWCRTTVSVAMKPSWPLHRNLLTTTVLSQASNRLVHFAT